MTEFQEFMESDEGRNMLLNEFLKQVEAHAAAVKHVSLIEGLNFEDLTPALWARIVSGVEPVKELMKTVATANKASELIFADTEAFKMVTQYVEKIHDKED